MANAAIDEIVEKISGLSAMDIADLSKAIQEKFGVTAAAPVAMAGGAMPAAGGAEAAEEEKDEFDVVLSSVGDKKIQVIKVIRQITNLGLKEAKELVESDSPKIKEAVTKDEANELKSKLEEVGANVEIK